MDGVLVVDKPEGPTSHDVVARVRRALRTPAIGHTGTLDPMATGVLVLVVGRATRLAQFLSGQPKAYDAAVRLGLATDTWDRTGTAAHGRRSVDRGRSRPPSSGALTGFLGRHPQMPPPFSAKKVEGVRAHELARRGKAVAVQPAMVELMECELAGDGLPARAASGCGRRPATTSGRSRTTSGGRSAAARAWRRCGARRAARSPWRDALPLDGGRARTRPAAPARLVPMERLLPDLPAVVLDGESARRAGHGNEIPVPAGLGWPDAAGAPAVRLFAPDGRLLGDRQAVRPGRVFASGRGPEVRYWICWIDDRACM